MTVQRFKRTINDQIEEWSFQDALQVPEGQGWATDRASCGPYVPPPKPKPSQEPAREPLERVSAPAAPTTHVEQTASGGRPGRPKKVSA